MAACTRSETPTRKRRLDLRLSALARLRVERLSAVTGRPMSEIIEAAILEKCPEVPASEINRRFGLSL